LSFKTNNVFVFVWKEKRMSEILKNELFVGDYDTALDADFLKEQAIQTIINVSTEPHSPETLRLHQELGIESYYWPCSDECHSDMSIYFRRMCRLLRADEFKKPLLIHCIMGVSRSASLAIAYVICVQHIPVRDALIVVRKQRPQIEPNSGFIRQLLKWSGGDPQANSL
jgi:dual specificity MAP kinase phosphatase